MRSTGQEVLAARKALQPLLLQLASFLKLSAMASKVAITLGTAPLHGGERASASSSASPSRFGVSTSAARRLRALGSRFLDGLGLGGDGGRVPAVGRAAIGRVEIDDVAQQHAAVPAPRASP